MVTKETVTEIKAGTIPPAEGPLKDAPPVEGKTPVPESKVSSEKLYDQKEADALVHVARSDAGRGLKEVETERDTLKETMLAKDSELDGIKEERATLQKDLEEVSSEDPKKFDIITRDKDLREREQKVKAERLQLDSAIKAQGETIQLAQETLREISIWDISAEYEGASPVKLKDLCETFEAKSDEQIRKVAETIWAKKEPEAKKEPDTKPLKIYSGITEGGGEDFKKLPPAEKVKVSLEKLRNK